MLVQGLTSSPGSLQLRGDLRAESGQKTLGPEARARAERGADVLDLFRILVPVEQLPVGKPSIVVILAERGIRHVGAEQRRRKPVGIRPEA